MKDLKAVKKIIDELIYIMDKKQKRMFVLILFLMIVGALLELVCVSVIMPLIYAIMSPQALVENKYVGPIIHFWGAESDKEIILLVSISIICMYIIKNLFTAISMRIQIKYRAQFQKDLSTKIMVAYMNRPYEFFVNTNSGVLLRGVGVAVSGVYEVLDNFSKIISNILNALTISIFIFCVDSLMAIGVIGLCSACFLGVTLYFKRKISILGKKQWEATALTGKYAIQALGGYKEIKVRQAANHFVRQYSDASEESKKATIENSFIGILPERIIESVCISGIILVVLFRVMMDVDVAEFIPNLAAFAVAAFRILPSIAQLTSQFNWLVYWKPSLDETYNNLLEVEGFENNNVEIGDDLYNTCEKMDFNSSIEVKNVSWRYLGADADVLSDFSMCINKGESIGIIGTSGAGKTTFADMLLGLLKPRCGDILIDGKSIFEFPKEWAKTVGYVAQTTFLLDESIRRNVAFGVDDSEIDDDRVWEALEQAQLKTFVEKIPEKLNHVLGEGGVKLSGGQRQRISIARTLYFNPDIVVLDEATSALDNSTEKAVMEAIEYLHGKKTMIIVAHRLSTIEKCDKIYEILNGKAYERR